MINSWFEFLLEHNLFESYRAENEINYQDDDM